jgi:transcriptional regulator with XRE-family HTH domain
MAKLTPFGIAIRKLRLDKGLRLVDMAEKLDMTVAFLSAIETGRKGIPDGLVVKISRSLRWPKEELAMLTTAVDLTRKEVRIGDKSEADQELVAVFARKLDSMPETEKAEFRRKLGLKSVEGEIPFERRRRGIVVPPLSTKALRDCAEKLRSVFVRPDDIVFPVIEVIELGMPRLDPKFVFEVRDRDEMGDDEGQVPVGGTSLILRDDVYRAACNNGRRARFTACHELAHYVLHRDVMLARAREDSDKIYSDSEWQADTFAGTLLMSSRHASSFGCSADMADACIASRPAAEHLWRKYLEEGAVRAN